MFTSKKNRIMSILSATVATTAVIGVAGAVPALASPVSPASASQVATAPATTDSTLPGATTPTSGLVSDYGIKVLDYAPYTSLQSPSFVVNVSGYTAGNWINLWYRDTDAQGNPVGPQHDWGGTMSNGYSAQVVQANQPLPAGHYIVQASIGKYPENSWSQNLSVTIPPVQVDGLSVSQSTRVALLYTNTISVNSFTASGVPAGTPLTVTVTSGGQSTTCTATTQEDGSVHPNCVLTVQGDQPQAHGTVTVGVAGQPDVASITF